MLNKFLYYKQMMKPGVTSLVLMTVIPGLYLGSETILPSLSLIFQVLFGTFLMCAASFIFNQVFEKNTDAKMERTKDRPIASNKISVKEASLVGSIFVFLSFFILSIWVNFLTAMCNLFGFVSYVFLYTIFLKPKTKQNIVIGGIAGCVGPLIGYAAVSNSIPTPAWVLFLMIFFWTPPHFWALAIFLKDQYQDANFPMLPVIDGEKKTSQQILIYTVLYIIVCISFPFFEPKMGILYHFVNLVLSCMILFFSILLWKDSSRRIAKFFFFFSIIHLYAINIVIVVDRFI